MSLLLPSAARLAAEAMPLLQERTFNVRLRCNCCDRERSQVVQMADEPNSPGSIDDFYGSDAIKEVDPDCMYCGETGATILGVAYVTQPGDDVRRPIG